MSVLSTYAPDIEEQILAALQVIFQKELQVQAPPGDRLALKTLKPAPLQDDPTLAAPYLVYSPDFEKGERLVKHGQEEREYGCIEIGGPLRFVRYYTATCGTPIVTSREQCYADINNLKTRVMEVLLLYQDLAGVLSVGPLKSQDGSKVIEGQNPLLIDCSKTRIKGGEQTWFGEGTIEWHYPVSWYWPFRVYAGGDL